MNTPVIAIHGGAGTISRHSLSAEEEAGYHQALADIVAAGQAVLNAGGSALAAVTEAVRLLEDCPLFNAGHGAVYTSEGKHELDASVMSGIDLAAGAVACVTHIRNPVLAARAVMEQSEHVLLVGQGAESFAARHGVEMVEPGYFHTDARHQQWLRVRGQAGAMLDHDAASFAFARQGGEGGHEGREGDQEKAPLDPDNKFGTVGAVALDKFGNLAAATSTGGITNKQPGRVGDSPLIGAGCYASNSTAAVSATGTGEAFMRAAACYDVAARMAYAGDTLQQATDKVVFQLLPMIGGRGGLIALDAQGNLALPFNTEGMYRAYGRGELAPVTAIYQSEQPEQSGC
ncbi:isoaspartyl peptidase/L-asparaginase family protein [Herbaspirillum sp. SJZ099]|uniref:isoaspartyl peptidase/L-asparaginase family protein n=1 Tax=Herbaspirillum sp. SJZ099 TaxID=2572916 RepID=UPI0011AA7090|nr:isoaspartyl peptidase/L-asparaginase [Herbaspirillum sp. SJZ099]TWC64150.1 beta-aspartyl-peptidase (threonine type) [Herbaspirillum sp. SJZ099]